MGIMNRMVNRGVQTDSVITASVLPPNTTVALSLALTPGSFGPGACLKIISVATETEVVWTL